MTGLWRRPETNSKLRRSWKRLKSVSVNIPCARLPRRIGPVPAIVARIQAKFVDDPAGAFVEADQLLGAVMVARGYPPTDFANRATEISVDHGMVVEEYRAGHDIAIRHSQRQASTEDLRKGMVHYRALFDELMREEPVPLRARAAGQS